MKRLSLIVTTIFLLFSINIFSQDIIMSNGTQSACGGTFLDPGGNSDYSNNSEIEMTLCPDIPGQAISINFTTFETEGCCDHLWIHNGSSSASPMITGLGGSTDDDYDGTELNGITVTSTSADGCLTFVWDSDGSVTDPGWEGEIMCVFGCQQFSVNALYDNGAFPTTISLCMGESFDVSATGTYPNAAGGEYPQSDANTTFSWDFGNGIEEGQNFTHSYGTQGSYDLELTVTDINNCSNVLTYPVEVSCGGACPPCTDILIDDPDVNTCVGSFWDSGLNDNYSTGEVDTITICSDNGGFVEINFNEFGLDQWDNDKLFVYDGPDVNADVIGVYTNTDQPTNFISTGTCLTFRFTSSTWSTPGIGWSADISCANPCQDMELEVTTNPAATSDGTVYTCPGGEIDFTANLNFPNNDVDYHQDIATCNITWSAYNGASGTGATFTLPADSGFTTEVMVDVEDINGCHIYDTIHVVSQCQIVEVEIGSDATVQQNGEIYIPVGGSLNFDGIYNFPESGDCYDQVLSELTWTFGFVDGNGNVIEYTQEDMLVEFPSSGVNNVTFEITDQEGCSNSTSVEVHVGCQPVDVSWLGEPAMIGDTIIVCPGDSFSIEIFTDYFANNSPYFQEDDNMVFNWNMGDGTLILDQMQPGSHLYAESGVYNVYLQMIDNNSDNDIPCIDDTYIPIYAFMEPSFFGTQVTADTICFGDSLLLIGNTTLDMPSYSAPPVFLPDGSGVSYTSTLTFDIFGDEILTDVNDFVSICMNMEHSYAGDLAISIICPNGQSTLLYPYPNSMGNHFIGEPVDNTGGDIGTGYEYCFTPQANQTWQDANGLYTYSYTDNIGTEYTDHEYIPAGEYAPEGSFDDLLGCPLNGDWVLSITDNIGADDGWIFDWSLTLDIEGLVPPDTTQLPLDQREWTVAMGGDAIFNIIDGDDAYTTPLDTGIYTFTFTTTSPAGCSYNTTVGPVYVAPVPEWTLGNDTNLCSSFDFTIPGTLSGGDGTWSFSGPPGATANFSNLNTIPTNVTVSTFGEYIFYFTPNTIALCANPDQIAVTFRELPVVSSVIDSTLCFGSCDGQIALTGVGPEAPYNYNYNWSNGSSGNIATDLCIGNHQVTVTSDYCSNTFNYDVFQPTQLIIYESGKTDNLCYGDLDGEMWVVPSGGTPGYSYTWSNTGNSSITTISNLSGGDYYVTIHDDNGCIVSLDYTIEEPEAPLTIHGIYPTNVACFGENTGSLETNISGGTPNYSYNWLLSDGNSSTVAEPENLIVGDYFVTVTDLHGCITTGSQVITEPTALVEQNHTIPTSCYDYYDGKAWITPSGGTTPYFYEWSNGSQDSVLINANAQTYTVTVTDAQNCIVVRDLVIEQPQEVILNIAPTPVLCIGESIDLVMSVTSSPFAPYTYFWNGAVSTETIEVSPQETTSYTAKVIDSHGCESSSLTKTVEVFQPLITNFSTDKVEVCAGEIVTVNLEPTGGNGNYTFTSIDGETLASNFTVQPEQTKIYRVIVGDDCTHISDTLEFEITVNEAYSPSFNAIKRHGCQPVTVDFLQNTDNYAEGTSYLWNFGDESSSSISFDLEPTHIYNTVGNHHITLEITTPKGCKSEKVEYNYISVYPVPVAQFSTSPSAASIVNPLIFFENSSVGGEIWQWNFGDGDSTYAWNIDHAFPSFQSDYNVELVVLNNYGCTDTVHHIIRIVDEVTLYTPTGFTPDGDGKNEIFKPYGNAISENDYSMYIYNRWGEIVFESTNINVGWNGTVKGGSMGPQGIYRYLIKYTDTYGVPHERIGNVNLLR